MKGILANKRSGFYVTVALAILSIATAAFYASSFGKYVAMSWPAFANLVIGAVAAVVIVILALQVSGTTLRNTVSVVGSGDDDRMEIDNAVMCY